MLGAVKMCTCYSTRDTHFNTAHPQVQKEWRYYSLGQLSATEEKLCNQRRRSTKHTDCIRQGSGVAPKGENKDRDEGKEGSTASKRCEFN